MQIIQLKIDVPKFCLDVKLFSKEYTIAQRIHQSNLTAIQPFTLSFGIGIQLADLVIVIQVKWCSITYYTPTTQLIIRCISLLISYETLASSPKAQSVG